MCLCAYVLMCFCQKQKKGAYVKKRKYVLLSKTKKRSLCQKKKICASVKIKKYVLLSKTKKVGMS